MIHHMGPYGLFCHLAYNMFLMDAWRSRVLVPPQRLSVTGYHLVTASLWRLYRHQWTAWLTTRTRSADERREWMAAHWSDMSRVAMSVFLSQSSLAAGPSLVSQVTEADAAIAARMPNDGRPLLHLQVPAPRSSRGHECYLPNQYRRLARVDPGAGAAVPVNEGASASDGQEGGEERHDPAVLAQVDAVIGGMETEVTGRTRTVLRRALAELGPREVEELRDAICEYVSRPRELANNGATPSGGRGREARSAPRRSQRQAARRVEVESADEESTDSEDEDAGRRGGVKKGSGKQFGRRQRRK